MPGDARTKQFRRGFALVLAAGLASGDVRGALACGFDAPLGNSFSAMHPKSIGVAVAIQGTVAAGMTEAPLLDPLTPGAAGYWRAIGRLERLSVRLSAAGQRQAAPLHDISILLIDSGLWSRFRVAGDGYDLEQHLTTATTGDVVVVTSEAVLAAILDAQIPASTALDRGMIEVDADGTAGDWGRQVLQAALSGSASDAMSSSARRPARLFGSRP